MFAFDFNEVVSRIKSPRFWFSWLGIFSGCFVMALGFVVFISPYNIVPGGVYGASIVLHNLFPSIQVGTFGYMFDIPLLCLSFLLLGSKLGARTVIAAMTTPAMMNILSYLAYPTKEALEALDPSLLFGGVIDLSNYLIIATIFGSLLIGIGSGLIVRCEATSGGTDIVAMIIQKYIHIPFSTAILLCDGAVVLFGLFVIGLGLGSHDVAHPSVYLSLYSLIAIYINSKVVAFVISGVKDDKILFVISDKPMESFRQYILKDLDRSATLIKSSGLYTGNEKQMFFLVVTQKEVINVKKKVKMCDPLAFVVVTDAYDTFGEGWKQLPSKDDINPE